MCKFVHNGLTPAWCRQEAATMSTASLFVQLLIDCMQTSAMGRLCQLLAAVLAVAWVSQAGLQYLVG